MPGNEVAPDDQVGFAVVSGEINPVAPSVTDLLKNFTEDTLVQWIAVHHDAVHVENDGLKLFCHSRAPVVAAGFSLRNGVFAAQPKRKCIAEAPPLPLPARHERGEGHLPSNWRS